MCGLVQEVDDILSLHLAGTVIVTTFWSVFYFIF